mmetsp:Transcript_18588/g.28931  ORF Transcript_18588/g.28931 Transcript_18588/m.28931 type:complete len:212 (+) Transcript_18588:5050-5685(+)
MDFDFTGNFESFCGCTFFTPKTTVMDDYAYRFFVFFRIFRFFFRKKQQKNYYCYCMAKKKRGKPKSLGADFLNDFGQKILKTCSNEKELSFFNSIKSKQHIDKIFLRFIELLNKETGNCNLLISVPGEIIKIFSIKVKKQKIKQKLVAMLGIRYIFLLDYITMNSTILTFFWLDHFRSKFWWRGMNVRECDIEFGLYFITHISFENPIIFQ